MTHRMRRPEKSWLWMLSFFAWACYTKQNKKTFIVSYSLEATFPQTPFIWEPRRLSWPQLRRSTLGKLLVKLVHIMWDKSFFCSLVGTASKTYFAGPTNRRRPCTYYSCQSVGTPQFQHLGHTKSKEDWRKSLFQVLPSKLFGSNLQRV